MLGGSRALHFKLALQFIAATFCNNKSFLLLCSLFKPLRTIIQSPAVGMATNPPDCYPDDFLEQILAIPSYPGLSGNDDSPDTAVSQLSSAVGGHLQQQSQFPSGLSLDKGHGHHTGGGAFAVAFQGQPISSTSVTAPHPPVIRPRVRARRGQATDPHSIAERLRRERITDRIKALQELVPSCNKTDRAAMLDEILDYVKFLRLQVKVLSMSRLGGAGAVAQLVANIPLRPVEMDSAENERNRQAWEKWSDEEIEQEVVKLMEEDVGAAMQFLQSKALCIMPISLAALIYPIHPSDVPPCIKPEPPAPL